MTTLWLDTETFSETPIKHGTYRYAENCEVMLISYAIDDGPVQVVDLTGPMLEHRSTRALDSFLSIASKADTVIAHNAMFDRIALSYSLGLDIPVERWRCTMVKALAHSLPGSLDALCEILNIPQDQRKLKTGKDLVRLFCQPRPKNSKLRSATRETHSTEWAQFVDYAKADIEAMRAVARKIPDWNTVGAELDLWHLDQRINDRGVHVDTDLARGALRAVDRAQRSLAARASDLSSGQVASATQRDALLTHILEEYGVDLPDMQASTIERRIADPDMPAGLRGLLQIRLQASTSSTSKYKSLINGVNSDGRLRGLLQFCGASRTGRWSGRTWQPQNLPRPNLKQAEIDDGIEAIKLGCEYMLYDNVMELTSNAIRGCITAPQGKKLVVSDLSNIEGRVAAWLAGEQWKLQAFRDFDAGTGHDLYRLAYAKSFGVSPESVTKDQRQIGKVQELALGYEGGVGAFVTFAAAYGIDLDELAAKAYPTLPDWALSESNSYYGFVIKEKRPTFGLSQKAFVTCDALKRMWRDAHTATSSYWPELQAAAVWAVEHPGNTRQCRKLQVRRDGAWLRIRLPSGRVLCYPSPQVDDSGKLSYMGVNQYSRKWQRLKTYGGKLFENVCQAVARDVMASAMPRIEAAGYEIVLTVHDEVICEAPDRDEFSAEHLSALLSAGEGWTNGLPLAAGGFSCTRYRKD